MDLRRNIKRIYTKHDMQQVTAVNTLLQHLSNPLKYNIVEYSFKPQFQLLFTFLMGQGFSKDKNVDIFLQTDKQFYYAGQSVKGAIYINCKAVSAYKELILKCQGLQKVYWSEGSGQNRRTYWNQKNTYASNISIEEFSDKALYPGHYTFPFQILLPAALAGTFYQKNSRSIQYVMEVNLTPSNSKLKTQKFETPLNIVEPLRNPFGPVSEQTLTQPHCCQCCNFGCCKSYGKVQINLRCDKNYVRGGEKVSVNCTIDNSHGKEPIKNVMIDFSEHLVMVSSGNSFYHRKNRKHTLYRLGDKKIGVGQQQTISFTADIPINFSPYNSAIGSIIALYFTIELVSSMGYCSNDPSAFLHIIYHAQNMQFPLSKKIKPPANWNPQVYEVKRFTDMPPYMYQPSFLIPVHNRQVGSDGKKHGKSNNFWEQMRGMDYKRNEQKQLGLSEQNLNRQNL